MLWGRGSNKAWLKNWCKPWFGVCKKGEVSLVVENPLFAMTLVGWHNSKWVSDQTWWRLDVLVVLQSLCSLEQTSLSFLSKVKSAYKIQNEAEREREGKKAAAKRSREFHLKRSSLIAYLLSAVWWGDVMNVSHLTILINHVIVSSSPKKYYLTWPCMGGFKHFYVGKTI